MLALAALCGCHTDKKKAEDCSLRVCLESGAPSAKTIYVLRSAPVAVPIESEPILSEANIVEARVIDAPGGFAIQLQFDESSTLVLEQYSAANPGKHLVIVAKWGNSPLDGRPLAAPLITHRISNGVLSFTPDMTRSEADRLVAGLGTISKETRKGDFK